MDINFEPVQIVKRGTQERRIWNQMKQRCLNKNNPAYDRYGGRGITIYPEWIDNFNAFFIYIGPRPSVLYSIERIKNDEGYFPGNVKWATKGEQGSNKRNNIRIEHNSKNLTMAEWARELGIDKRTIWRRIQLNWDLDKVLDTPIKSCKRSANA